jgi:hypothetical protein
MRIPLFYAPIVQDPSSPHRLYYGGSRLFCSTNDGNNWTPISPMLATSSEPEIITASTDTGHITGSGGVNVITAIGVALTNPDRLYVGYYGGEIFTTKLPAEVPANTIGLPNAPVYEIAIDDTHSRVYTTYRENPLCYRRKPPFTATDHDCDGD